jgi:hypothetical protein
MRYKVTAFKSLQIALKELEPFIRNQGLDHIENGKPFRQLYGMRPREALANWLLCATFNAQADDDQLTFVAHPDSGDGVLYDRIAKRGFQTEHVFVSKRDAIDNSEVEPQILKAISDKVIKGGAQYASGKILVVLVNAHAGSWQPNKVARQLPAPIYFTQVWAIALQPVVYGQYVYLVTLLDLTDAGTAPTWLLHIADDFDAWGVRPTQ